MKIKTPSGVYEVKRPVGRIGARHMALVTKLISQSGVTPGEEVDAAALSELTAGMSNIFEEWSTGVLKHILVSGPHGYDDMPGEDQYAVFLALMSEFEVKDEEFFQVVG